ncbi:MAG: FlgD immunoglobulin-like domain containing protein, partial [Candidatus Zixiibacteriota bacterium]
SAIYITTIFDNFTSKDITQNSYHSSSTMSVEVINNEGDILTTIYEPYDGLFCTGDSTSFINEFQFLCSGNMVTSDADNEILVKYEWQQNCYSPPDNSYISSGSELKLYRLVSSDSTELIWTVDNVDNYSDFFYSTKYPGYFFTIKDGVIYQFNGVYGSPYQTSVQLLADSIIWINSFNEDFGNIVTINNQTISVYKIDMTLTVEDELENNIIPSAFVLSTPYPNPFNPSTIIEYSIPHRSQVTISIYNIAGQKVTTVINEIKPAGAHQIIWDGKNDSSEPVSSGIYLIKATLDNEIRTAKAVLLK